MLTSKISDFFSLWAFLKYYHPAYSQKNKHADNDFLEIIKNIKDNNCNYNNIILIFMETLDLYSLNSHLNKHKKRNINQIPLPMERIFKSSNFGQHVKQRVLHIFESSEPIERYVNFPNDNSEPHFDGEGIVINMSDDPVDHALLMIARCWTIFSYFSPFATSSHWSRLDIDNLVFETITNGNIGAEHSLRAIIGALGDGHTKINSENYDSTEVLRLPFNFVGVGTGLFVNSSLDPRILPGDELVAINETCIEDCISSFIDDLDCRRDEIKLRDAIRKMRVVETTDPIVRLNRNGELVDVTTRSLTKANFWVWASRFLPASIDYDKAKYLNLFHLKPNEFIDALRKGGNFIIDLRSYPKHDHIPAIDHIYANKKEIVGIRTPDPLCLGNFIQVSEFARANETMGNDIRMHLLVDDNTQSYPEYLAICLAAHENTKIIGTPTAGATGNKTQFKNVDGHNIEFTGLGVVDIARGTGVVDKSGIFPDVIVKQSLDSIQKGRDDVLDKSLDLMNEYR